MADLTEYCSCVLELSGCGWVAPPPTYPPTEEKWLAIAYAVSVFCVVAFAVYAIIVYTLYMRKMHRDQTAEEFCTAKGTQVRRQQRVMDAYLGLSLVCVYVAHAQHHIPLPALLATHAVRLRVCLAGAQTHSGSCAEQNSQHVAP